ncbi:MAG: hypothetical protein AAGC76_03500 [Luteibacter sp.]|uniref:hypothetical protein n=1 Tax=Luteibacter sp. TaxID=1886636 RepID=UPI0028097709|nr:hypothetical protein [Luteibacter sp.]MDQ7994898.1 hypothetical protein [Luteibacter sp.]MDQ8047589.1 hypothetical protein [Luteibacter sp.]
MKKRKHLWTKWPLVLVATMTTACGLEEPLPERRATAARQSFPLGAADKSTTIDFWIREGDADLGRPFMVAIEFATGYPRQREYLIRSEPPLRVRAWRVDAKSTSELTVLDMDGINSVRGSFDHWKSTAAEPVRSMMHLHVHGHTATENLVVAAGFRVSDFGHYRVSVGTVYDLPIMDDVQTEIVVRDFYNMGK